MILILIIIFSITACQKDWDQIIEDNQVEMSSMSDMVISSEFDWKTTKDIEINLSGLNEYELIYVKSIDGDIFHKGVVNLGGNYMTTITIPTYLKGIILKHVETEIYFKLTGNKVIFVFS